MTPCTELDENEPTDIKHEGLILTEPDERGVRRWEQFGYLVVDSSEVDDWEALVSQLRDEWKRKGPWRSLAVLFDDREAALELNKKRLRKPSTRGWYPYGENYYQPRGA